MLNEVIIQQAVFKLIHSAASLRRKVFESDPDEKRTANVVALDARFATLAAFQTGDLFAFAVQRLDLPAGATHLLGGRRGILSLIVGHDIVRAVGRHLNPEALHFMVFGEAFDLDPLALRQGWLRYAQALAEHCTVSMPSHPGFDGSERPAWLKTMPDLVCFYTWFLETQGLEGVPAIGFARGGGHGGRNRGHHTPCLQ